MTNIAQKEEQLGHERSYKKAGRGKELDKCKQRGGEVIKQRDTALIAHGSSGRREKRSREIERSVEPVSERNRKERRPESI